MPTPILQCRPPSSGGWRGSACLSRQAGSSGHSPRAGRTPPGSDQHSLPHVFLSPTPGALTRWAILAPALSRGRGPRPRRGRAARQTCGGATWRRWSGSGLSWGLFWWPPPPPPLPWRLFLGWLSSFFLCFGCRRRNIVGNAYYHTIFHRTPKL